MDVDHRIRTVGRINWVLPIGTYGVERPGRLFPVTLRGAQLYSRPLRILGPRLMEGL